MPRQNDLHAHFSRAPHDRVEILHFEPQQHAVPVRLVVTIADPAVMMFHCKAVQLKDKLAVRDQPLILRASMIASQAEQALIPPAARFHIGYCNQRLRTHRDSV